MLIAKKYARQRGQAIRLALVVVMHVGAATALFCCAKPFRQVQVPETWFEVRVWGGPDTTRHLAICPDSALANAQVPDLAGASHGRPQQKDSQPFFLDDPWPNLCAPEYFYIEPTQSPARNIWL